MKEIICELFDKGMIEFGRRELKDGRISPIYVNLRSLPSFPGLIRTIAEEMLRKIRSGQLLGLGVAGLPMSGIPLAIVMGQVGQLPVLYPREHELPHRINVEGRFRPDETVIAVDDVLTDGKIKLHQIGIIQRAGLSVRDLIVVVDRQEGGETLLEQLKVRVHSLTNLRNIVEILRSDANLAQYEYDRTLRFLNGEPFS